MGNHAPQTLIHALEQVVWVRSRQRECASKRHAVCEQDLAYRVDLVAIERAAATQDVEPTASPVVEHRGECSRLELDTLEELHHVAAAA